ncbi:MAG: hypothetical protein HYU02_01170 [Thaumarchaeota archaeon]|nr:hypothetical protein [Nitrososphaerota archaeon]
MRKVTFTKHATEKFNLLRRFGFRVSEDQVIDAIISPGRVDRSERQTFSMKVIDKEFALRVVHEERKGIILVITFYPVRRKRYEL